MAAGRFCYVPKLSQIDIPVEIYAPLRNRKKVSNPGIFMLFT